MPLLRRRAALFAILEGWKPAIVQQSQQWMLASRPAGQGKDEALFAGDVHIFPDSETHAVSLNFHASRRAGMSVYGVTAHDSPRRAFAV